MFLHPTSRREAVSRLLAAASTLCGHVSTQAKDTAPLAPHPRLVANAAQWEQLSARRDSEPALASFLGLMLERARADLSRAPVERNLEGRRLLGVSREFIRRTLQWAFAFRLTGDRAFLDRACQEMLAVAAFSDWHPEHYLDVAEMTTGMAIGYDWLFHELTPADRTTLRRAIVNKGIAQARRGHKTFAMTNNWGQVCIGGMVLGAVAVLEDEPELAQDLLRAARTNAFRALDAYQPDGVYPEGPSYWNYGTTYEVLLIATLRTALGTDWGLMDAPGLQRSALFYAHGVGPTGKSFNFADGGEAQELSAAIFYFAQLLKQPALVASKLEMIRNRRGLSERFAPLIALWWPTSAGAEPALHFAGQGPQPVAIWRSSWTDPNALYFAIKGGGAAHNHAHMDAGSFILDLDGVRWAKDLGMQDYNSLESRGIDLWNMRQGSSRWQVFRLGSDAHNTLTLHGQTHSATGSASLTVQGEQGALVDLTPVLQAGPRAKALRTVRVAQQTVTLSDQVTGAEPGHSIRWAMTTEASILVDGQEATLQHGSRRLLVRFTGSEVALEVRDISTPRNPFDSANPNTRQLLAYAPVTSKGEWGVNVRFSRD